MKVRKPYKTEIDFDFSTAKTFREISVVFNRFIGVGFQIWKGEIILVIPFVSIGFVTFKKEINS